MVHYERVHMNGRIRDTICLPCQIAGEADEALQTAGFRACKSLVDVGDADDEDGNTYCQPSMADFGRGAQLQMSTISVWPGSAIELWTTDQNSDCEVGFVGTVDWVKRVCYATPAARDGGRQATTPAVRMERSLKGAITALLDVAEACRSRRVTLGLGAGSAANPEIMCSLLFLGFQVVPRPKAPLENCVVYLDLDVQAPGPDVQSLSDATVTATSDCTTSADDLLGNNYFDN